MDSAKNQITDRLTKASNVLVTVSTNPSLDQLASAIGFTLILNKLGKHATAVFSGEIPNTIEFLQPEKTLEKTTDSLRDFIIALDKSKADKLRYKVEDQMVKIFITPYRTSITDKDLEFSQGDFNVDVVMAVGVTESKDLDQAITSHGRILHDATVISVNTHDGASLGSINWIEKQASSLCEMLLDIGLTLKEDVLDGQMATAFLTGIVAETNRYSNEKTTSATMQLSAKLIAAGANQQLVASKLQPPVVEKPIERQSTKISKTEEVAELPDVVDATKSATSPVTVETANKPDNGTMQIDHGEKKPLIDINEVLENNEPEEDPLEQIDIDKNGIIKSAGEIEAMKQKVIDPLPENEPSDVNSEARLITQPPMLGGTLTANTQPEGEGLEPSNDLLGVTQPQGPILSHDSKPSENSLASPAVDVSAPTVQEIIGATPQKAYIPDDPAPVEPIVPNPTLSPPELQKPADSLSDLERVVDSPHLGQSQESSIPIEPLAPITNGINAARDAVNSAVAGTTPQIVEPIQSLNARPMDLNLGDMPAVATSPAAAFTNDKNMINPSLATPIAFPDPYIATNTSMPANLVPQNPSLPSDNTAGSVSDPTAPPPVPPPMIPPIMSPPTDTNIPS